MRSGARSLQALLTTIGLIGTAGCAEEVAEGPLPTYRPAVERSWPDIPLGDPPTTMSGETILFVITDACAVTPCDVVQIAGSNFALGQWPLADEVVPNLGPLVATAARGASARQTFGGMDLIAYRPRPEEVWQVAIAQYVTLDPAHRRRICAVVPPAANDIVDDCTHAMEPLVDDRGFEQQVAQAAGCADLVEITHDIYGSVAEAGSRAAAEIEYASAFADARWIEMHCTGYLPDAVTSIDEAATR
ncbi:MAG: hypothetical protein AB7L17_03290 [Ilumatobacteraceae bacterium]